MWINTVKLALECPLIAQHLLPHTYTFVYRYADENSSWEKLEKTSDVSARFPLPLSTPTLILLLYVQETSVNGCDLLIIERQTTKTVAAYVYCSQCTRQYIINLKIKHRKLKRWNAKIRAITKNGYAQPDSSEKRVHSKINPITRLGKKPY